MVKDTGMIGDGTTCRTQSETMNIIQEIARNHCHYSPFRSQHSHISAPYSPQKYNVHTFDVPHTKI